MTALSDLGFAAVRFVTDLGRLARFAAQIGRAALAPPLRVRLFVDELFKLGVLSLVIICVCGLAVGMVLSLQGYNTLVRFGAEQSLAAPARPPLTPHPRPPPPPLPPTARAGPPPTPAIRTL